MTLGIVSREEQLSLLRSFVGGGHDQPCALVLEGEPGIGKTTLWSAGVDEAEAAGRRVLTARPAEAEQRLAYVGLGDLFENALDGVLPELPAPRQRALEVALVRESGAEMLDPRAVGLAVRDVLALLAGRAPVLVATDDLQWLDDASARALAFAVRRLADEPVSFLCARRTGSRSSPVEDAFDDDRVERVTVGPLSAGALHRLLQSRLGAPLPRPTLLRLHELSAGNPFYALELARAGGEASGPLPESLERLVRGRLDELPQATRDALLLVAAGGRLTPAVLAVAGISDETLAPAFAARVVERDHATIRFAHPLLASARYHEEPEAGRRRAHRLLADAAGEPVARARHLALSADGPDAAVAAAVADAATTAAARGAGATAAELAEHALRLTPPSSHGERHARTIEAARLHLAAGDAIRARRIAGDLVAASPPGASRAEALALVGEVEGQLGNVEGALESLRLAVRDAPARVRAVIHQRMAFLVRERDGLAAGTLHARAALRLSERLGDDALRARALGTVGFFRFNGGELGAQQLAEQAHELAVAAGDARQRVVAALDLAHVLMWSWQLEQARHLLQDLHEELRDRDEPATASVLWYLSHVELRAGRLALAAAHAETQHELYRQYAGEDRDDPLLIWPIALVAAHRGELDEARTLAERSLALAATRPVTRGGQQGVLGLVDAWSGEPGKAVEHFAAADEARHALGWREPALFWWRGDYAEALLELGRVDEAVDLVERWEADAARLGREQVLAQTARCRGLVAAARGQIDESRALLADAAARHERVGDPFGRARALLALGVVRRRAREKRPARDDVESALAGFEAIGAAGWEAAARRELGRIGGRAREEGLTAAERRVAALVAEGHTNSEVAAALFLGERTVASHLTHIYAKLGVRSRTELARKVQMF
jgi:DNA-binding CsgD family transcriptional regulator